MPRQTTWEELPLLAKKHNTIIVTGSQRSGTTFGAKAIANYLEYRHYDEHDFGVEDMSNFESLVALPENKVIQAPAILHELKAYDQRAGVLLLIMTRDADDVAASMIKHGWFKNHGYAEYNKFKSGTPETPQQVYETKIEFSRTLRAHELPYNELQKHGGFVRKEERSNWHIKQVSK